ncbi:Mitochondrial metal transporter 2 [Nakaseomyces bracarensis]|uniref:Mitochondrial metal transporter 2 n=1 Tax=Nakaseomyces bracarensis TaxID=273131 RepID=A0ABR4NQJ4_9SACH
MLKISKLGNAHIFGSASQFNRRLLDSRIQIHFYKHRGMASLVDKPTSQKSNTLNTKTSGHTHDHNHVHGHGHEHGHEHSHIEHDEMDSSHRHVHMRESETETNDSFSIRSILRHSHTHSPKATYLGSPVTKAKEVDAKPKTHVHSHLHHHGHGHTHSHTGGNPLLVLSTEEIRKNAGVRITWIGLGINVAIAVGKFAGGIVFHSQALFADAIHALSDMVADFLTLFSVDLASNKPSEKFPYGYGKVETVGSLAVSTILAMAGLSIGWTSVCALVGPMVPHTIIEALHQIGLANSHHHHHSVEEITKEVTDINAAWIAAASIVAKEWVFRATKKVAIATNSNVLMANAWHHRVDSLTSLVAFVTITAGHMFNIQSLDTVGGLIVAIMIMKAGIHGMSMSVKELVDEALSKEDPRYEEVESIINETLSKLVTNNNSKKPYTIQELRILSSGPNLRAHLILTVPKQRWDNILDIGEFELITAHLRKVFLEELPSLIRIDVEYIEERDGTETPDDPEKEV